MPVKKSSPQVPVLRDVDAPTIESEWQRKGATLSDKTARKEFGLTQDEIVQAIRALGLRNPVLGLMP